MLLCKDCKKVIANSGNPVTHYSLCTDCRKEKQKENGKAHPVASVTTIL